MDKKNPFNEASKARRLLLNKRNAERSNPKMLIKKDKDNKDSQVVKELPVDLSAKDNKSGRGRYV